MANPFIGEIRQFGFNFAPRGWAVCDGSLVSIQQNTALFALLGTTYGGDGRVTYGLPDLRGRVPIGFGNAPGLRGYVLGEKGGTETATLSEAQMPAHRHEIRSVEAPATRTEAPGRLPADSFRSVYSSAGPQAGLAPSALQLAGQNLPHNNRDPYLGLMYCIALQGIFPQRP